MGYEFPACAVCNDASAEDELIMGWLVRIQLSDISSEDEAEMESCLKQLHTRHPDLVDGMKEMSRNETRRLLREQGLSLSSFPGGDVYAIKMPGELLDVPKRYGEKLGKAMYYLHTGQIVPSSGYIHVKALTNVEFTSPKFPLENFNVLDRKPVLSRSGKPLEDQFSYRYAIPVDGGGAAFLIQFRESIVILVLVYEDGTRRKNVG